MRYLLLLLCVVMNARAYSENVEVPTRSTVAVIGAGLAGLTTAYRLHGNGCNVHVYEARERVGGRVFTALVNGHVGELGAQNIRDGGDALYVRALLDELHLSTVSRVSPVKMFLYDEGRLVPMATLLEQSGLVKSDIQDTLTALAARSKNMDEVMRAFFGDYERLYRGHRVLLAAYEGGQPEQLSTQYIKTFYYMLTGGISAAHQGGSGEVKTITHEGVQGGNSRLPEAMAATLGDHLHLGYALEAIDKDPHGYYRMLFANGQEAVADIVVLAIPCPVYRDIRFHEDVLNRDRLEAIQQVAYGISSKVLVPVTAPEDHVGALTNDRVVTFHNVDAHVLNSYYANEAALFNDKNIEKTFSTERRLIEMRYEITSSKAAVCARDRNFQAYDGPVGHSWGLDPYAKGAYSFIAADQDPGLIKALFAPIGDSLYFCGEHTSTLGDVGGTMEAAVESGEKVARLIMEKRKNV